MANLSQSEFLKLIKEPKYQREIQKARAKRLRHRLHTQAETDNAQRSLPHELFLKWVKDLLNNEDTYERFCRIYRVPITSNELTESIFSEFEKVFEGQNRYEKFEFTNPEDENDFYEFRKRKGDMAFWPTQGFETFKDSIDDILIVDLPKEQTGDKPEPYYYILDIDALIDIKNVKITTSDEKGADFVYFKTEYIIFNGEDDLIYCFDDTYYRAFKKDENENITFVSEVPHNLGYCPARSFWTTPLNAKATIQKRSVITNSLSELDWYVFFSICRKYAEMYASYPIYAVYKGKCDYKETASRKGKCVGGYMEYEGEFHDPNKRERCPRCKNKLKIGPGNVIEVTPPQDKTEQYDLMANPIKVIPAETTSLEYIQKALEEKRNEIWTNCVGRRQDVAEGQPRNEIDVKSGFESAESALLKVKKNFEIIHHFALDTWARLRYGDSYVRGVIDYGDQFFNIDEAKEMADYKVAAENGSPSYELRARMGKIFKQKYKNDPDLQERLKILSNIDPFPQQTITEVLNWKKSAPIMVSDKDLLIKMKFENFIDRFEREQTNILLFASAASFDKKIEAIKAIIEGYATEYLTQTKAEQPEPDPAIPPKPSF
jgi:hypothetical protein